MMPRKTESHTEPGTVGPAHPLGVSADEDGAEFVEVLCSAMAAVYPQQSRYRRDREVLAQRLGLLGYDPHTLAEIGESGLSRVFRTEELRLIHAAACIIWYPSKTS